jgi:hypothetical protein
MEELRPDDRYDAGAEYGEAEVGEEAGHPILAGTPNVALFVS